MSGGEAIKGHLDALLLAVLSDAPLHGYAVVEALRARSGGRFELPEGTVYPALHRLEADGLLSSRWSTASGRRRREYALTAAGRRALGERVAGWRSFAGAVESVLGASAPASRGAA
jgi:PadR family transcriptional regulator, regulatory protein PadR